MHVDAPTNYKDYPHRSGRTARAGEPGTIATLATTKQQKSFVSLPSSIGLTLRSVRIKPLAKDLRRITGAQEPSSITYVALIPDSQGPNRGSRRPHNSDQRRRHPR